MGFFCTSASRFVMHADSGHVSYWWGLFLRMRRRFTRLLFEKEPYINGVLLHKRFSFYCARRFRVRLSLMRSLFENASQIHEVTFWKRALCKWGSSAQALSVLLCTQIQDTSVIDEVSFWGCVSYSWGHFLKTSPIQIGFILKKNPIQIGFFCTSTSRFVVHADSGYVCHWWGLFLRMRLVFTRSLFEEEPYVNGVLSHKRLRFCCARMFRIRLSLMRSLLDDAPLIH